MRPRPVLYGKRFGRLVVVGPAAKQGKNARWECRCDCGNAINARVGHLDSGNIQSCGCLASERARERLTTHGRSRSPMYARWIGMLTRCYYPETNGYRHYGGRGIKVCGRWRNSFADFLADVGEPPSADHTLDRRDVNGNYEPRNVRWATPQEQSANSRRSIAKRDREAAERLNVTPYEYQLLKSQLATKRKQWKGSAPMRERLNILTEQVKNMDQYQRDGDSAGVESLARCMRLTMREIGEIEAAA